MSAVTPWKGYERVVFRIAFIFFILMSLPNNLGWYTEILHFDLFRMHYRDLYDVARFGSGIDVFGTRLFGSTLLGYADWIITLLVALAGGTVWTFIARRGGRERREYNQLYYWLRVMVRYRAGIGIIGFGFTKLLPTQMPYPSLGILDTNFGDLTAQKIFWLSVGIVPWYQVFAGVVETTAGVLLFFRKTTTLGALLLFGALGDIVYVNFAYDGGVHVYSSYFVLLAGFLLWYDVPDLYKLLIRERPVVPVDHYPALVAGWQTALRYGLKTGTILVFLVWLFYLQVVNFLYDPYKQPAVPGVAQLRGNFQVKGFSINHRLLPYDPTDSVRWLDATFEKWSTLTFRVHRPTSLDLSNGGGDPQRDVERDFELAGVGGGRRVFHYYADTVDHVLYLEDKYRPQRDPGSLPRLQRGRPGGRRETAPSGIGAGPERSAPVRTGRAGSDSASGRPSWIPAAAWAHIGSEVGRIDPLAASARRDREYARAPRTDKRNHMILHYSVVSGGNEIVLDGIDEHKDSIRVVLERNPVPFTLKDSDLQAGKYD